MGATTITDEQWNNEVLEELDRTVLVDLWAEWCGPCRMVTPIVEEIANERPDTVKVVKLNIDENPKSPEAYGVKSIPTLLIFSGGELVKKIVGAKGKNQLLRALDNARA